MYGIQYLERVKKTGEVGVVTRELVKHKSGNKDVIETAEKRLRFGGRETGYLISGANGRLSLKSDCLLFKSNFLLVA